MPDYPLPVTPPQPQRSPRRVRAYGGGRKVLDTTRAMYVWERPAYPMYYVPVADVEPASLAEHVRAGTARVLGADAAEGLVDTVRFEWSALDAWYEEDEQLFGGHPRNPYSRVDAVRSNRPIRVELDGVVLAEAPCSVMVFETGLPPRYYLDRTAIRLEHHEESDSVSSCPYKGQTSQYWSVRVGADTHHDVAWSYDFPTRQLLPIAGLVAYYNEKVDIWLDGRKLERPRTHFS